MKYLPILLFISLFLYHKSIAPSPCSNYKVQENIKECLFQDPLNPRFTCCGVKYKFQDKEDKMKCEMVGKTKSHFDYFKKIEQINAKELGGTAETLCIETTDEVKGTCDEFKDIKVEDQKQCHKLTAQDYNKTCCGVQIDFKMNEERISVIECHELKREESERKGDIEKIEKKYGDTAMAKCDCKEEFIDYCYYYKVKNNINECLSQDSRHKHFSCCGGKFTYPNGTTTMNCVAIGNTKSHRNLFNEMMKLSAENDGATYETACPDIIDEIKGTCQEYDGVGVDNQGQCLGLSVNENDKSCCGLKIDVSVPKKDKSVSTVSMNGCVGLSKNLTKRSEEMEKLIKEMDLGDYAKTSCQCEQSRGNQGSYYIINLFVYISICFLLIL